MKLRIKEIAKQKGIQLKDIASQMGIAPESLTRMIHGNPQLETLEKIAGVLGVELVELFQPPHQPHQITGYLECDGQITKINNKDDLFRFTEKIKSKESL